MEMDKANIFRMLVFVLELATDQNTSLNYFSWRMCPILQLFYHYQALELIIYNCNFQLHVIVFITQQKIPSETTYYCIGFLSFLM